MGLSTAERNRRKRERRKKEKKSASDSKTTTAKSTGRDPDQKEQQQEDVSKTKRENESKIANSESGKNEGDHKSSDGTSGDSEEFEIEYVVEPVIPLRPVESGRSDVGGIPAAGDDSNNNDNNNEAVALLEQAVRRFQERSSVVVTDDDDEKNGISEEQGEGEDNYLNDDDDDGDDEDDDSEMISKRRLRDRVRPTVAELKRKVDRPDLVEAHDVTAMDPEFLLHLKSIRGTVPVPRHWGRKRKYLQGKRGYEKPPFELPDFITATGITEVRDTVAEEEASQSIRQKNRQRVAPKMGAIDVDYRTLHDAFFKHQTKPTNLTRFGDLYYEGKELEVKTNRQPGLPLSPALRDALGMTADISPPPWLLNMQRYGPPPSYPALKIPGLNAPLPSVDCQYGYHPGGWGKPPIDPYNRPLYGGNPFDPPGSDTGNGVSNEADLNATLVTSDGKTIGKLEWGALPTGDYAYPGPENDNEDDESDDDDDESDDDEDMQESEEEVEDDAKADRDDGLRSVGGVESVLPPPPSSSTAPVDLRKQAAGDETPAALPPPPTKQLYQVVEQTKAKPAAEGTVFASEVAYFIPNSVGNNNSTGDRGGAGAVPEGAESVLSKALPEGTSQKDDGKAKRNEEEDDDIGKNFKF